LFPSLLSFIRRHSFVLQDAALASQLYVIGFDAAFADNALPTHLATIPVVDITGLLYLTPAIKWTALYPLKQQHSSASDFETCCGSPETASALLLCFIYLFNSVCIGD
jgi:hypothetical protein